MKLPSSFNTGMRFSSVQKVGMFSFCISTTIDGTLGNLAPPAVR